MDLRALPVMLPLPTALLEHLARVVVHVLPALDDLHALALRAVDLAPHRLVRLRRVHLRRVDALLRDRDDRAPPELFREVALGRPVDAAPYWLEALLVQVCEVRLDDAWDLLRGA